MDTDLALIIGLVLGVLSVPAGLSAYSDGRAPLAAAVTLTAAVALVIWAVVEQPGGYRISEIPDVVVRVLATFIK